MTTAAPQPPDDDVARSRQRTEPVCDCGGTLRTCPCDDARESGEAVLDREAEGLAVREPLRDALRRIGAARGATT